MADDEPTPEALPEPTQEALPDLRVVSIIHDADADRFGVSYDEDLDPFHALGLLMAGMFRQLIECTEALDLEDAFDDDDGDL